MSSTSHGSLGAALERPPGSPDLAAGLRAGSEAACEALLRLHGSTLLWLARTLVPDQAESAVREAFLAAFRSAKSCPAEAELGDWLQRLLLGACLARLGLGPGSAAADDERTIEPLLPRFGARGVHLTHRTPAAGARELAPGELRACIERLPAAHRVAVLLADVLRQGNEQSAALLGISPVLFAARLHRARLALVTLVEAARLGPRALPV